MGLGRSAFDGASCLETLVLFLVVRQAYGQRSESLERHVTVVLAQEAQKALVVRGFEIETLTENDILHGGEIVPGFQMSIAEIFELG